MKAKITWYGHSCFKVESELGSIVFDPYENGSVPGLTLPHGIKADVVSCSHGHADHDAADLIELTGNKPGFKVSKITVSHDHHGGAHRGLTDIVTLTLPGLVIVHLGDLGSLPTLEEYAEISKADVVLLPCAGYFTIASAEAAEVIKHLKRPSLKILMHYREGKLGYDVQETIEDVMKDIHGVRRLGESSIEVDSASIPDEIVTLRVKNED